MGAAASGPRVRWPGCTALAAVIHASQLHIANAGDCRAILCRDGAPVQLSRDHTTADHQERQRIIDAGGKVAWRVDSWRIGEAAIQVGVPYPPARCVRVIVEAGRKFFGPGRVPCLRPSSSASTIPMILSRQRLFRCSKRQSR